MTCVLRVAEAPSPPRFAPDKGAPAPNIGDDNNEFRLRISPNFSFSNTGAEFERGDGWGPPGRRFAVLLRAGLGPEILELDGELELVAAAEADRAADGADALVL